MSDKLLLFIFLTLVNSSFKYFSILGIIFYFLSFYRGLNTCAFQLRIHHLKTCKLFFFLYYLGILKMLKDCNVNYGKESRVLGPRDPCCCAQLLPHQRGGEAHAGVSCPVGQPGARGELGLLVVCIVPDEQSVRRVWFLKRGPQIEPLACSSFP